VKAQGLDGITAITAGSTHSLALKSDGTVYSWGVNSFGQLGNGTTTNSRTPVKVKSLTNVVAIASGWEHNLALTTDGTVYTWGANGYGQLGIGTTHYSTVPAEVRGLGKVTAIGAGGAHALALKPDGTLWAWGYNYFGQLGNGDNGYLPVTSPVKVKGLNEVRAFTAGDYHSVAAKPDGTVWAWGYNYFGQLGNGMTSNFWGHIGIWHSEARYDEPVAVQGLSGVSPLVAGGNHTLAITPDGNK
jgi:alpha-tubulin suppressor-like RCC1 family protein